MLLNLFPSPDEINQIIEYVTRKFIKEIENEKSYVL